MRSPSSVGGAPPTRDHDEFARMARAGDTAALDMLLELIDSDGSVRIPVRKVILNPHAVDDVCQDVLILVAERIAQWGGRSRFTTWLYSVARNKAIDQCRATRPVDPLPDDAGQPEQSRISSLIATRVTVAKLVEQLPAKYRDPVMLRDIGQHDYAEIAAMLGVPAATVRTRVARGRPVTATRLHSRLPHRGSRPGHSRAACDATR